VYLKAYDTVREARAGIDAYMNFYNNERPHQALCYRTPAQVYHVRYRSNIRHRTPIVIGEAPDQISDTVAADSLNSALSLSN
ncbi:MAG: transposase, partial [Chloroflexi bacterium]|nr:transposase [Chloroflexota bacterium]